MFWSLFAEATTAETAMSFGIGAGLTTLILGVLKWWTNDKKADNENDQQKSSQQQSFIDQLINQIKEQNETVKAQQQVIVETQNVMRQKDGIISKMRGQVRALQKEVRRLQEQVNEFHSSRLGSDAPKLLETIMNAMPKPAWIHEVGKNLWYVNNFYSKTFGVPRNEFWDGINIFALYPSDESTQFVANDLAIIKLGSAHYFIENFPRRITHPESNDNPGENWDVVKMPIKIGERNYIFGVCTQSDCNQTIVDFYKSLSDGKPNQPPTNIGE